MTMQFIPGLTNRLHNRVTVCRWGGTCTGAGRLFMNFELEQERG